MTIPPVVSDLYREKIYPATPQWGDIYMISDNLLGPYAPDKGIQLTQTSDKMMMVRFIKNPEDQLVALSFWQGYEFYWKDWIKNNGDDEIPCILQNPRDVKFA